MEGTITQGSPIGWVREITRSQWLVLFVVWLGWALDATDFNLFSFVLRQAVTDLLGGHASLPEIGKVGGLLTMVGLLGWAVGGFVFGIIADYVGRVRTLALSILIYSVFTALQGLAQTPVQFGFFRFFAGVGTGAEIVVGIPLLAEAFAEAHRAKVLGVMMTGGAFGSIIGGWVYGLLGGYGWRVVFFVGVTPALLLLLIRRGMVEPEHFAAVRARRQALASGAPATGDDTEFLRFVPAQLFNRQLRHGTLVGLLFAVGTLLAIWTSVIWLPTIQSLMLEKEGISGAAAIPLVSKGMILWGIGGMFGYATFGFLADAFGRRPTILFYNVGTLIAGLYLYLAVDTWTPYLYLLPIFGYFVFGVFSGHAIYLPELFPTHVRATALSFCNGAGRVITSFGPLVAGLLVAPFGGNFNKAAAVMTCFALVSIFAMYLARETKGAPLPS